MSKPIATSPQPSASVSSLFKISLLSSALAAIGLTTGCATTQSPQSKGNTSSSAMLDAGSLDSLEDLLSATDMRAVEGDRLLILKHGDVWKRMTVGFKMDSQHWDPRIDAQRGWFISRQPYLDRLSARASRYLYHTVKEAERRGLPTELALLPIIESSYDPAATSSAAAAGMWQFIPSTGRIYGLRQTGLYDGRRDVVESTRAAYEFLGSLYNQFGSWELALAAYNAGPGRIQQAINRNQAAGLPTDYWSLRLPQETMNYVPRFLAVAQIIKEPHKYNVSLPPIANRPHFREVTVPAGAQLNDIANVTGLSRAELYALNPGHRGDVIDASSTLRVLIPADLKPTVDSKLRTLSGGSAGSGSYWATSPSTTTTTTVPATTATVTQRPSTTTTATVTQRPSTTTTATVTQRPSTTVVTKTPVMTASTVQTRPSAATGVNTTTPSTSASVTTAAKLKVTPQGSNALAQFASNADVPSAPRIPVAITPAANVKPVVVEPAISAKEREQILASILAQDSKETPEQVLNPQASTAERDEVVKEITALAPQGTEVVDPLDGKIKLTAIQTSQSVATQKGQEVSVGFAYPKSVAKNTQANSEEAQLNRGKNFQQNNEEVVVVAPKGKRSTYTVLAGDTLAIIAAKNGVSWRDLATWNQVSPNGVLYAGTTLYLYDAKPVESKTTQQNTAAAQRPTRYVVKANDSLTGLAAQFGLSVQQLANYNDLSVTSSLYVGQRLSLVETEASKASQAQREQATKAKAEPKIQTQVYTVQRGEYLKLIADRHALSNQELASLTDGLEANSALLVGQKINVPVTDNTRRGAAANSNANRNTSASSNNTSNSSNRSRQSTIKTVNYKVQAGESLYSIANQAKMSLNDLAELNQFAVNTSLLVGQTIKIPESAATPESYVVRSGDSLGAIANQFDIPLSRLAALNGLTTQSNVRVGQRLKLQGEVAANNASDRRDSAGAERNEEAKQTSTSRSKASSKNTERYTVKSGESLTSIAGRLGMSVQELASLNNLNARSGLRVGQTIQIPKLTVQYRVKSGDSLIRLASRYGIEAEDLAEMNRIKPNANLRVGEVLQVPNL